jgi:tetratricopeptide (TPR) repeat protein
VTDSILQMAATTGLLIGETAAIPVPALADFHQGLAMMEAGQAREAVAALRRCVELAPSFTAGHLCLGVAHAVSCSVYPAIDHLQKATELSPLNFAAHYTLARFYFTLRIPNKGYEFAERSLECANTREERVALSQLLQKERERERNGIARPLFDRHFGRKARVAVASMIAACICAILVCLR